MPEYPLLDLATQRPEPGHYVYRLFDAAGLLLYVGSTGNVWERFGQHAGRLRQPWWGDVDFTRTLIEHVSAVRCLGKRCPLPDHAAMLTREVELIKLLEPRHNKNSTNRCKTGRHQMTPENTYIQPEGGRTCKECRAERWAATPEEKRQQYARERRPQAAWLEEHPEAQARRRAHKQTPEIKARAADVQREYRDRPEVRERLNAQQRERRQRLAVQAKLREYAQKPEVRASKQEYRSRPEVNDRINVQQRERYAQRKVMPGKP